MTRGPKATPILAPRGRGMDSKLYLVGTTTGIVKVGQSYHPRQRLRQHRKTFGEAYAWHHVFAGYRTARMIESDAIAALSLIGRRVNKTEHFTGIDKATAIACVRRVIAEYLAKEEAWAEQRVRNMVEYAERQAFSNRRPFCWLTERPDTPTTAAAA